MDSQDAVDAILKSHRLTFLAERIETAQLHLQRALDTIEVLPEGVGDDFPSVLDAFSEIEHQRQSLPTPSAVRHAAREAREPVDVLTDSEVNELKDAADSPREAEAIRWELERRQDEEIT